MVNPAQRCRHHSPMLVRYNLRDGLCGRGKGFLLPSSLSFDKLRGDPKVEETAAAYHRGMKGWANDYLRLVRGGTEPPSVSGESWNMIDYTAWVTSFYIVKPIYDDEYVDQLMGTLERSGFGLDWDRVSDRGVYMMNCTCGRYFNYAWCEHSCAFALMNGIITKYPVNLDPTAVQSSKRGRPSDARKGDAWNEGGRDPSKTKKRKAAKEAAKKKNAAGGGKGKKKAAAKKGKGKGKKKKRGSDSDSDSSSNSSSDSSSDGSD